MKLSKLSGDDDKYVCHCYAMAGGQRFIISWDYRKSLHLPIRAAWMWMKQGLLTMNQLCNLARQIELENDCARLGASIIDSVESDLEGN